MITNKGVSKNRTRAQRSASTIFWYLRRYPTSFGGGCLLGFVLICSIFAPLISGDPNFIDVFSRMKPPSADYWFGTDMLGRDIYNRTVYGGRVSLWVGLSVASLSTLIGLVIGLASGYWRQIDTVVMRTMDGIMAIPGILFAMALVALTEASIGNVIFAITVVETPRVVRLVRSVVLTLREQPYVDAAVTVGSGAFKIMFRHILPNTMAPLIVQATFICAQAILIEAALSFLGVGTPSEVPTWGNIISEGRLVFQIAPWNILFPGIALSLTVLSMNLLGDGLRDTLDPRLARRM